MVVVLALAGIGAAAGVLHARQTSFDLAPVSERLLYLRSPKAAERLVLDFDALAADVYWIRSIQSYGRDLKSKAETGRFELVQPLLDLTTSLDPHFLIAYRFGAVFLAMEPPQGPGRADLAIQLLEKGLKANPTSWWLAYDIAFTHYFHTGDFNAASEWFSRAAAMPGAPTWLGPLAATTRAQGGNRQDARQMLRQLLDSPDGYIRRAAGRALEQLDALDAVDQLTAIVNAFNASRGRYPSGWDELVRERMLRAIPTDNYTVPFVYDPVTHAVTLSAASPLSPLPETLRAK